MRLGSTAATRTFCSSMTEGAQVLAHKRVVALRSCCMLSSPELSSVGHVFIPALPMLLQTP